MLWAPLLLLAGYQDGDVAAAIAKTRELTRSDVPCRKPADDGEIVVCSRRDADKYRVPLVLSASPKNSVPTQTAELLKDHGRMDCGQGAFTAQCGSMVGVSVSVGANGIRYVPRELAP